MSTLLAFAAAREGAGLLDKHPDTLALGVGKIAAAMTLTAALAERRPDAVLLVGVGGAYPARHLRAGLRALQVLEVCVIESEIVADDGVLTPDAFLDLAQLRLAEAGPFACDAELTDALARVLGCPRVAGATVSTGAGVDVLSQAYAARSGAQIESMEGAAVVSVCRRFGVPLAQLRVVSNRTGDRSAGGWDLDGAIARLERVVGQVLAAGVLP